MMMTTTIMMMTDDADDIEDGDGDGDDDVGDANDGAKDTDDEGKHDDDADAEGHEVCDDKGSDAADKVNLNNHNHDEGGSPPFLPSSSLLRST